MRLERAVSRSELDVSDREAVFRFLDQGDMGTPHVLVNATAFTDVDGCEANEASARAVNVDGPKWLAEWCQDKGVRFVHVSTDYVFDGNASSPYRESDAVAPNTSYGRTKEEGEREALSVDADNVIIRTSWLFGPGKNFVASIVRQAKLRRSGEVSGPLRVVSDQQGSPTYAGDLASAMIDLISPRSVSLEDLMNPEDQSFEKPRSVPAGIFHLSNAGQTSWFEFAREILDRAGYPEVEVLPISAAQLDRPAVRPAWSVLDCGRAAGYGVRMRDWREALSAFFESTAGRELLEVKP